MKLWPDGTPGPVVCPKPEETFEGRRVRYVSEPTLTVYLPAREQNTGVALIVCPGGGYGMEAMDHEGYDVAEFLQSHGVAGIVLKYRLPYGHSEIPLQDAQQAMRMVRLHAEKWAVDPTKIGIAGFSAGGHLASTLSTHFDTGDKDANTPIGKLSCRPDFSVLLYPVVTFKEEWGHMGSRENLIGKTNDWKIIEKFSNELQVTKQTPPAFIALADDDTGVKPRNSIEYYLSLKREGIQAELHIFREGGHGFGMHKTGKAHDQWPLMMVEWMKAMKYIKK
ncbi:MAG: alpha/beta hydrolase [Prolixibacteraceae bacterium]|nr:alpha/beta hydrolase [Prolixibacteraceae bacterium]